MNHLRKIYALAALAVITVALSGCTGVSDSNSNPKLAAFESITPACEHFVTGSAADQIQADVYKGVWPEITFPLPLRSQVTETKIQQAGSGPAFTGDELINFDYQIINGSTGDLLQASSFDGSDDALELVTADNKLLCHPLSGVTEGSLVSVIMPWGEFSDSGLVSLGFNEGDSLILTIKLNKVFLPQAVGEAQPQQSGFPQVVTATSGEPGLILQDWKTPAFTSFAKATLVKGRGEQVQKGQTVTLHYSGFLWDDSKAKFDSSWQNGQPTQLTVADGQLIPGFIKTLVGETVGSRIISVIPPQDGYGSQNLQRIPANSTLIFVVDILGVE